MEHERLQSTGEEHEENILPTEERDKAVPSAVNIEEEEEKGVDLVRRKTLPVIWFDAPESINQVKE